jgi:hypothetical protein
MSYVLTRLGDARGNKRCCALTALAAWYAPRITVGEACAIDAANGAAAAAHWWLVGRAKAVPCVLHSHGLCWYTKISGSPPNGYRLDSTGGVR